MDEATYHSAQERLNKLGLGNVFLDCNGHVDLNGPFTATELEAIASAMRGPHVESRPVPPDCPQEPA